MLLDDRVGDVADQVPHAARILEVLGVDICCHRERSLRQAAAAVGLQSEEILDLLNRKSQSPAAEAPGKEGSLRELTLYVVGHHHRRARHMLVNLALLAGEVASSHHTGEIHLLHDIIERIARELIPHMRREEQFLFPYIDSIEREMGPDETIVVPLFGRLEYPLQSIHHDHAEDLALLNTIRDLTNNFTAPKGSCERVQSLYPLLEAFERELQVHIGIENEVLFPRAIEAERNAKAGR
ncbi:MAG TPA: DUF542 domain-containing protein [Thermoanaerobaculia bacterium]|jgi:regulator of cell morphogenesis and NO signaling